MYNDRPSTKHMVLTLFGWIVGLLVVAGIMVAISTALAPETPSDTAPAASDAVSAAVTPTVEATAATMPDVAKTTPVPLPVAPAPTAARSSTAAGPLEGKVVVIDAGHQARGDSSLEPIGPGSTKKRAKVASGASGVRTRNAESLINLQVALSLQEELVSRGAKVVMVRTKQDVNIANSSRAKIANDAGADLFVRLHCDGNSDASTTGISTLVPKSNTWTKPIVAESKKAGTYVHDAVIWTTGANDRKVVSRGDLSGFNWAKVPTVLVEMGFLSNPDEDVKLGTESYQNSLAAGLASGIQQYLSAD